MVKKLSLALLLSGCVSPRGFPPMHGIQNFDSVTEHVWRGAQPNRAALMELKAGGVRTVVNLRDDPWPFEAGICSELGLAYYNYALSGIHAPDEATVNSIVETIRASEGVVFIHCAHGCDRTGLIVACYRIRQGDDPWEALEDAKTHGLSPVLLDMKSFIRKFK